MKIKYEFLTGEIVEIEVPDSLGEVSIEIERDIYNSDRRETRRHNSISNMEAQGIQIAAVNSAVADTVEVKETMETLNVALGQLLPQQRELVHKVFNEGLSIADIARTEGVGESAIRDRLSRIYKKIKIILK